MNNHNLQSDNKVCMLQNERGLKLNVQKHQFLIQLQNKMRQAKNKTSVRHDQKMQTMFTASLPQTNAYIPADKLLLPGGW